MFKGMLCIIILIIACAGIVFGGSFQSVEYTIDDFTNEVNADAMKQFIKIGQKFYYIDNAKVNWYDAAHRCRAKNAELASIRSEDEMKAINKYLFDNGYKANLFWISNNDLAREGRFQWLDTGEDVTYSKWSDTHPDNWQNNENCVHLWVWSGEYYMNDGICTNSNEIAFICEKAHQAKQLTINIW